MTLYSKNASHCFLVTIIKMGYWQMRNFCTNTIQYLRVENRRKFCGPFKFFVLTNCTSKIELGKPLNCELLENLQTPQSISVIIMIYGNAKWTERATFPS